MARRGRLPDLSALVPGLRRRRGRRPARASPLGSTTSSWLGVDALWLSPIYPSPGADCGYDISDFTGVDPELGTLADVDELIARGARARACACCFDLVPEPHLDRAPLVPRAPRLVRVGRRRPAEQLGRRVRRAGLEPRRAQRALVPALLLSRAARPRLARTPRCGEAMGDVVRFWLRPRRRRLPGRRRRRASPRTPSLRDDPPAIQPFRAAPAPEGGAARPRPLPATDPGWGGARGASRGGRRRAAGGRGLPADRASSRRYLDHLDLAFSFEFLHAPRDAGRAWRAVIEPRRGARAARPGSSPTTTSPGWSAGSAPAHARARRDAAAHAAGRRLHLPGRRDRDDRRARPPTRRSTALGRDGFRHPMQWERERHRRVHARRPLAAADRSRRAERRRPATASPARCSSSTGALIALRPGSAPASAMSTRPADVLALPPRRAPRRAQPRRRAAASVRGRRRARARRPRPSHRDGELAPGEGTIVRLWFEASCRRALGRQERMTCLRGKLLGAGIDAAGDVTALSGLHRLRLRGGLRHRAHLLHLQRAQRRLPGGRDEVLASSRTASTRSRSSSSRPRPTPSASSSFAGSAPRTTRSTSSAWT